ncbi:hypothetical protein CWE04_11770 [Thomasclavelia cocleata]|uniref:Phage portal protein, SPP1 family n=1 Tax=Thomasclavelia cocleata TaxID=69824 RepID=A0A1I0BK45_9FIRM|nr:hypothetical protein [Thomasclavelia cocleata]NDO41808.1 hypothetical protein [Thomasclavelia cocleata]PJN79880.1 hypothetical protein CWE04_11770 [Thomasclavelia cocleata]SET07030.1 hypothetical protein SAMN04489758_101147 [Thomasclavelia cocleata]
METNNVTAEFDEKTQKMIDDYIQTKFDERDRIEADEVLFENEIKKLYTSKVILNEIEAAGYEHIFFTKFKKKDILMWLENPSRFQHQLRSVSMFLYNVSNHYKRLIKYFSSTAMFAMVLKPRGLDTAKANVIRVRSDYNKTSNMLINMNLKHEFLKLIDVVFREEIFYGYVYETKDSFYIRKLPVRYCHVRAVEDGTRVVSFDFSYFDRYKNRLNMYGSFFKDGYKKYRSNRKLKWQDIPSGDGICIKFDESIDYSIPPFAGVFSCLYDLEDYKNLKKNKEKLNNYKLISLKIPVDDNGKFKIPEKKVIQYYKMIDARLPENIGIALTPMDLMEHTFERAGQANTNAVAEALEQYWGASGVSSLLFSSDKSGTTALKSSILVDSALLFPIYRQLERWLNYRLKKMPTEYKFRVQILNVTELTYDSILERYMKTVNLGIGISELMALLGYEFNDVDNMLYLEHDVLDLHNRLKPLQSSYTQSSNSNSNSEGRPKNKDGELEIEGENTRVKRDRNE